MKNEKRRRRPRGRPKSEAKKQRIRSAAIELFVRHGYEGTSMDMVAGAADVSKQTLYSHFDGKDDLFAAAVEELCRTIGLPGDLDAETRPLRTVLTGIGRGFLTLLLSAEAVRLYRLVLGNAGAHPEVGRIFYETGPRTFIARLSALLEARAARGEIEIAEPRLAAAQLFSMLRGELHMRVALGVKARIPRRELERWVDDCVDVFLRGHGG